MDERDDCEHDQVPVSHNESDADHKGDGQSLSKRLRQQTEQRQWVKRYLRTKWPEFHLLQMKYTSYIINLFARVTSLTFNNDARIDATNAYSVKAKKSHFC